MDYTINSRTLGREVTFSRHCSDYIYADLNGRPGTLGGQICEGGGTTGSTICYCGDDEARFRQICRTWYRSYIRNVNRP